MSPATSSPEYALRKIQAVAAVVAHAVCGATLILIDMFVRDNTESPIALRLLLAQEVVALASALYAWGRLVTSPSAANYFYAGKWVEYSVSATLGTLAVYVGGATTIKAWTVAVLVFLGTSQQLLGRRLDDTVPNKRAWAQFWLAVAIQMVEFYIVYTTATPETALFVVYLVMWSAFGVLCGLRLWYLEPDGTDRAWVATRWGSELMYATLGWMAKVLLVGTALPSVISTTNTATTIAAIVAAVGLATVIGVLYIEQGRARKLYAAATPLKQGADLTPNEGEPANSISLFS